MANNVVIFVADALRFDYLPDRVADRGHQLKTVSASTLSPPSFASIASGLHPPEHGVRTFFQELGRDHNYLSLEGVNTSFWQLIESGGLEDVLTTKSGERKFLTDISPPFVYLERELSTHAPYNEWTSEELERRNREEVPNYFSDKLGDWEKLRETYAAGADEVGLRFEDRLETLADRGLIEDTLVIFTSDHGELLGEYGEWSHSTPVVPELVYVPTVIFHPDDREIHADFFRHVDVMPTVVDALDVDQPYPMSGTSVFAPETPTTGYCEYHKPKTSTEVKQEAPLHRRYEHVVRSLWDAEGGHAFNQSPPIDRLRHLLRMVQFVTPHRPRDMWAARQAVYHHLRASRSFGAPAFTEAEAREEIAAIVDRSGPTPPEEQELSEEQREQLEQLGYI